MKNHLMLVVLALLVVSALYVKISRHHRQISAADVETPSPATEPDAPPPAAAAFSPQPIVSAIVNKSKHSSALVPDAPLARNSVPVHIAATTSPTEDLSATPDATAPDPLIIDVPEEVARAALDYVGADPDADVIWMLAINDPLLGDEARQNLIEDLNENGFADPDHPTMDDLPLIDNRLALIEALAPDAMDDVNMAAFQEAYKDLIDMRAKLVRP